MKFHIVFLSVFLRSRCTNGGALVERLLQGVEIASAKACNGSKARVPPNSPRTKGPAARDMRSSLPAAPGASRMRSAVRGVSGRDLAPGAAGMPSSVQRPVLLTGFALCAGAQWLPIHRGRHPRRPRRQGSGCWSFKSKVRSRRRPSRKPRSASKSQATLLYRVEGPAERKHS